LIAERIAEQQRATFLPLEETALRHATMAIGSAGLVGQVSALEGFQALRADMSAAGFAAANYAEHIPGLTSAASAAQVLGESSRVGARFPAAEVVRQMWGERELSSFQAVMRAGAFGPGLMEPVAPFRQAPPAGPPPPAPPLAARALLDMNAARADASPAALDRLSQHVQWRPVGEVAYAVQRRAMERGCAPRVIVREALHQGIRAALIREPHLRQHSTGWPNEVRHTSLLDGLSPDEYVAWFLRDVVHHAECWLLWGICLPAPSSQIPRVRTTVPAPIPGPALAPPPRKTRKPRSDRLDYTDAARAYWRAYHLTGKLHPSNADVARHLKPDVASETVRRAVVRFHGSGQPWPPPVSYDEQTPREGAR
jgi:hypothetical protein